MTVTVVKVADHMVVVFRGMKAEQNSPTTAGTLEANVAQHVSITGANSVSLSVTLHSVKFAAARTGKSLGVEFILEQSNDRSNWHEVDSADRTGGVRTQYINVVGTAPFPADWKNEVTMAWVRVTFLIASYGGGALADNDAAVVSCNLTTSLN